MNEEQIDKLKKNKTPETKRSAHGMNLIFTVLGFVFLVILAFIIIRNYTLSQNNKIGKKSDNLTVQGEKQIIPKDEKVLIQNNAFIPARISIRKGARVFWTNTDTVEHTVTAFSPGTGKLLFDSPPLARDESYSHVFEEAGNFPYSCRNHKVMTGVIEVGE